MKIGIDSYCYHRFFGEVYPDQQPPENKMTMEDFLVRARQLGVDGVSLESCFFPSYDAGWLAGLRPRLVDNGFARAIAWATRTGSNAARTGMPTTTCWPTSRMRARSEPM